MANVPNLSPEGNAPAAPTKKAPKPAGEPQKWFKVKSGPHRVPRPGGDYVLNRGKVISSASYNIQQLQDMGVELESVAEPGWHRAKQGEPEPEVA
jgi:hypothetical protein